ncbi:MraY family glycosyltransferase [Streptomyces sp. NPDC058067]|uniref:MraY family glycosyltransferase n=1 Tax=Streptomyces sp. NPDC058067 TaxID=3346324 RepID=UPI0036E0A546
MFYGIAAAATALLATAALTAVLRRVALRTGVPGRRTTGRAGRRVPRLGGVAVAVVTAAVTTTGACTGLAPLGSDTLTLLLAAGAVALFGFVDDVRPLGARPRIAVEAAAASVVVHTAQLGFFVGALAVLWIVFVTNAGRLFDSFDGVFGTVAVVTALGLSGCAAAEGLDAPAVALGVLAAALTGFLVHNWYPARIRLGSCGSLFTGFLLASAAVLVNAGHEALPGAGSLFGATLVVTADLVLVTVSRKLAGRPLFRGGGDHIAHRLRRLGLTPQGVAVVLGVASLAGTVTGVLLHSGAVGPLAALGPVGLAVLGVVGLLRVPVYGVRGQRSRGRKVVSTAAIDLGSS